MTECPECDTRLKYSIPDIVWFCENCGYKIYDWQFALSTKQRTEVDA